MHYQGSVVIVSHDKYFLNRMVTKIVELYQQAACISIMAIMIIYEREKPSDRIALQQRAYENQQDYIRQKERLVEQVQGQSQQKQPMAQSLH